MAKTVARYCSLSTSTCLRWEKSRPLTASYPHRKARRTTAETVKHPFFTFSDILAARITHGCLRSSCLMTNAQNEPKKNEKKRIRKNISRLAPANLKVHALENACLEDASKDGCPEMSRNGRMMDVQKCGRWVSRNTKAGPPLSEYPPSFAIPRLGRRLPDALQQRQYGLP